MKKIYITILLLSTFCFLFHGLIFAQDLKIISATIRDEDNKPLPGVEVVNNLDNKSIISDNQGTFTFITEKFPVTLTFRLDGYKPLNMQYENGGVGINITMKRDIDMVSVAYGKQSRKNLTSSVSNIWADEIMKSRSSNIGNAMKGLLPGLTVMQSDGAPGSELYTLRIRGTRTINGSTPLFIVDGMERDIYNLDINNISSISVLKDAAATSIYGLRGANGVVLIETKRGEIGESRINVNIDYAMQSLSRFPEVVSAADFARLYNESLINNGSKPRFTDREIEHYTLADSTDFYPVRNFTDEFIKDIIPLSRVNVNFSGGEERLRYYTSIGYQGQKSMFITEPFEEYDYDSDHRSNRFNFRTNLDFKINNTLNAWIDIAGHRKVRVRPAVGSGEPYDEIMRKLLATPNLAHNDLTPDGEVIVFPEISSINPNWSVYGMLNRTGMMKGTEFLALSTAGVEQKLDFILPGLSFKLGGMYDALTWNDHQRKRSYAAYRRLKTLDSLAFTFNGGENTALSESQGTTFNYRRQLFGSLHYDHSFGRHAITGFLRYSNYKELIDSQHPWWYIGYAGRLSYGFDDRYMAEFSFAYDGSEQFMPGNQYGFFPAFSLAWVVSEEGFMKNVQAVNLLKFRASAGIVGNDDLGVSRFSYLNQWTSGGGFTGITGTQENVMANPNLTWESFLKYDAGMDVRLFDFLNLSVDYFLEKGSQILVKDLQLIPLGFMGRSTTSPANIGETTNYGAEFVLGFQKRLGSKVDFSMDAYGAYSHNNIDFMSELAYDETYVYAYRYTGFRIGERWGYESDGLFNTQAELDEAPNYQDGLGGTPKLGDIKYVDQNEDGFINQQDMIPLEDPFLPEWNFGMNMFLKVHNFDLSVILNGAAKRSIYLYGFGSWDNYSNYTEWHKYAWTQEKYDNGEKISYPELSGKSNNPNYKQNDYWIFDGSYLKIRNIEVGYTLPATLTRKFGSNETRIFANGSNLLTFDKLEYKYFDPEQNEGGEAYPSFKAFIFGLSIKF